MKYLLIAWIAALCIDNALANEDSILTWDSGSPDPANPIELQYNPQYKLGEGCALPDSAPWVYMAPVPAGTTTATHANVSEGTTVCYRVSASDLNRQGESDWSVRAEKTVPFSRRPVPANLQVQ